MKGGCKPPARFLAGSRIGLRPLERTDLPRCQEDLLTDPGEEPVLRRPRPELQRRYDAGENDVTDRHLHPLIEAGGTLIGQVSLKNEEYLPGRTATFGIFIGDPGYLGRGYGTEARELVLNYAFSVLGYHEINPDLVGYNTRAPALYEKPGFVREGRESLWPRCRFWDGALTGITAGRWWARHGPPPEPTTGWEPG
jgi:RimJ/RimL family protein N-acetyltransferase